MPGRLENIKKILENVENKGRLFLESLLVTDDFEIMAGQVKVQTDTGGKLFFLRKPGGMPVWCDLTLVSSTKTGLEIGLSLDFYEYELEYAEVRVKQLAATYLKEKMDVTDALEALVLASLVKDTVVADALIFRISKQFPETAESILNLLNRGNTRVRSAIGRVVALSTGNQASIMKELLNYLSEENADGVRADIITTYILQTYADHQTLPESLLEVWLGSSQVVDALSCIMALNSAGQPLPARWLPLVNEQYREQLAGWFSTE